MITYKKFTGFENLWPNNRVFICKYLKDTGELRLYNSHYWTPISNIPIKAFISIKRKPLNMLKVGDMVSLNIMPTKEIEKQHLNTHSIALLGNTKWKPIDIKMKVPIYGYEGCRLHAAAIISEQLEFDNDVCYIVDVVDGRLKKSSAGLNKGKS